MAPALWCIPSEGRGPVSAHPGGEQIPLSSDGVGKLAVAAATALPDAVISEASQVCVCVCVAGNELARLIHMDVFFIVSSSSLSSILPPLLPTASPLLARIKPPPPSR